MDYVTADITTCIHQAHYCTHGVTFAMWLWLEEGMTGKHNFILRSDLDNGDNWGYRLKYLANHNIVKIVPTQLCIRMNFALKLANGCISHSHGTREMDCEFLLVGVLLAMLIKLSGNLFLVLEYLGLAARLPSSAKAQQRWRLMIFWFGTKCWHLIKYGSSMLMVGE